MASSSASSTALPSGYTALADSAAPPGPRLGAGPHRRPADALAFALEEEHPSIHGLIGRSPVMRRLIQQMRRMAPHLSLATIEGEEGTGRTLAARALHASGPVPQGPFVPCLATLFFSAEHPATSGPNRPNGWSAAIVEAAHTGMLFLDRIHQLSTEQQERLADFLHWFDDRHFHLRSGAVALSGPSALRVPGGALPAQIVFATSVPLRQPGNPGHFRDDLASRLCSVRFHLPPLSQRREDIPLLAQIFIQRFAHTYGKPVRGLGPGTIAPLLRYGWPGNVRELEETINAAALETESQWIRPIDLPPLTTASRQMHTRANSESGSENDFNLDHAIRNHVGRVLARTRGNKLRAAQLLGISRSTLYRILAEPTEASRQATAAPL